MAMDFVEDLKKLLAAEKLVLGTAETLKLLRKGKLQKIFLASGSDAELKVTIERYCKMGNVEYVEIAQTSEEIGVLCRKPFAISIVGVLA